MSYSATVLIGYVLKPWIVILLFYLLYTFSPDSVHNKPLIYIGLVDFYE